MNTSIAIFPAKPARVAICAVLAVAITGLTTQTIVHSAGQHQYGLDALQVPAAAVIAAEPGRITVAMVR